MVSGVIITTISSFQAPYRPRRGALTYSPELGSSVNPCLIRSIYQLTQDRGITSGLMLTLAVCRLSRLIPSPVIMLASFMEINPESSELSSV